MENEGVELALRSFVYKSNDWNVSLFVNMAHNKNRIVSISNALSSYNDKADQEPVSYTHLQIGEVVNMTGHYPDAVWICLSIII